MDLYVDDIGNFILDWWVGVPRSRKNKRLLHLYTQIRFFDQMVRYTCLQCEFLKGVMENDHVKAGDKVVLVHIVT